MFVGGRERSLCGYQTNGDAYKYPYPHTDSYIYQYIASNAYPDWATLNSFRIGDRWVLTFASGHNLHATACSWHCYDVRPLTKPPI